MNKNHSHYEKSNVIERCLGGRRSDVRFVLEHAGDVHDHNASNHGNDSPATAHANDDYNDAHGRRLLIARVGRGCVFVARHVAVSAFQKQH